MYPESRSRTISFRLTHHEYERFRHLCTTRGHDSVSEMVRSAVNNLLGQTEPLPTQAPEPEIQTRVSILESHVAALAAALAEMDHRATTTKSTNQLT
jgi:Arc/MetJ-type ribon-helix-helix transcriptional regulator